jgi:hypothetical protein
MLEILIISLKYPILIMAQYDLSHGKQQVGKVGKVGKVGYFKIVTILLYCLMYCM